MKTDCYIYIGNDTIQQLVDFCQQRQLSDLTLVSDQNTYAVLGERVHHALEAAGHKVTNLVMTGEEVIADEKYLMQTLIQAPTGDQTFIGVGTGTITDLARYISFRTRNPFISVPTAPSVDGFLSSGAPLIVGGIKETYVAQGPLGIFTDLKTSIEAPMPLKAAGFGDILGKVTSLADWKLGSILWNEPYDEVIEQRVRTALESCTTGLDEIAGNTEQGIRLLMDALLESGLCIQDFGNSRPASGAEHHCSHYWELQLLRTNRSAILHGAKVGYATMLIAHLYEEIRRWTPEKVAGLLENSKLQGRAAGVEEIRKGYGAAADGVIRNHGAFLDMTEQQFSDLKTRILDNWGLIQTAAETVPPAAKIAEMLKRLNAPTTWQALGLQEADIYPALQYGNFLRNRFTIIKLIRTCGVDVRTLINPQQL